MSPFIRNKDIITISPVKCLPVIGDVVVIKNTISNSAVVHRIVQQKNNSFLIKGDNCDDFDGLFSGNQIPGIITRVERKGKQVWFGNGPEKNLIAFISRTGILNTIILPVLRKIKNRLYRRFYF